MKRGGVRKWLVIGAAGTFTAAVLAIVWLLYTESGLNFIWNQAESHLPQELSIEALSGRATGPIEIHGLQWRDEDIDLALERAEIDWRPGLLLFGSLHADRVEAQGLRVTLMEDDAPAEPEAEFALPESIGLPLRLRLRELLLQDAELRMPELDAPLHIERLATAGTFAGERLQLEPLDIDGPDLRFAGKVDLRMRERWPVELAGDWALDHGDFPALSGRTKVHGDLDELHFEQSLSRPFELMAEGQVNDPLESWRVDARFEFAHLDPAVFVDDPPPGRFDGHLRLSGDAERMRSRGRLNAADTDYGNLALQMDVLAPLDLDWIEARQLHLIHRDRPLNLDFAGRIDQPLGELPSFDGALGWTGLAWPLDDEPSYRSEVGSARIEGNVEDFRAEVSARVAGTYEDQALSGQLEADARGSTEYLEAFDFSLILDQGPELALAGSADWRPEAAFAQGSFEFSGVDPGLVLPEWPGNLNGAGEGRVHWPESGLEVDLDLDRFDGRMLGEDFEARGALQYRPEDLRLSGVEVRSGPDRLLANGRLRDPDTGERSDLDFELEIADLSRFPVEDLGGRLAAVGELSGTVERPDIALRLDAGQLRYGDDRIGRLDLDLDLRDGGFGENRLSLETRRLQLAGEALDRLDVSGRGSRDEHRLAVELEHVQGELGLMFAGALDEALNWTGQLEDLHLFNPIAGTWTLAEAVALNWQDQVGHLDQACLAPKLGAGLFCLEGEGDAEGRWSVTGLGTGLPLAMLVDTEDTGLNLSGDMDLELEAGDDGDGPRANLLVSTSPAYLSHLMDEDEDSQLIMAHVLGGQAVARWRPDNAWASMNIQLADGGFVEGNAELVDMAAGTLDGRIDATLHDLALLPILIPEIGRAGGSITAGLDLGGDLTHPIISGDIRLREGILGLPDLGIVLREIDAALSGSEERVSLSLEGESGEGRISVAGELDRIEDGWSGELAIQGEEFLAADLREARVRINPDLTLGITGRRIDVTGDLEIPWARIRPRDMVGVVQPSADEVIVGDIRDMEAEAAARYSVHSRVRTVLGEDVHFRGFGLEGNIRGDVTTTDEPGQLTRAVGELQIVDGQYEAWRQRLEIERGRLLYTDTPITDPALDVRAVRRPRNVMVGVQVRGTLREPTMDLFSEPAMSESEQLSYLLTGMPLTEAGEGERNVVREAAAALRMAGGEYVGQRLGDRLGVDDVSVETGESPDETTVVLGKWISSDVYVSYGIGLLDAANVFRLRYNISRRWDLEAQSGPRSGADFIYSLERG